MSKQIQIVEHYAEKELYDLTKKIKSDMEFYEYKIVTISTLVDHKYNLPYRAIVVYELNREIKE